MSVVIDASVALKWVLDEPGSEAAAALLDEELAAPEFWLLEAANALWRRARRHELTREQASARLVELSNAPVATSTTLEDFAIAFQWAGRLDHPVYDCLYLALALRENTHVVTADRRFHAAVQRSSEVEARVRLLQA